MAEFVVPRPRAVSVPVRGGGLFPVRRVYCVGRNYAEHAREMGHDPDREPPFFFAKPADALVIAGGDVPYPRHSHDVHHEIELVLAIGRDGEGIAREDALAHVYGYAAGIDLTARDVQAEAKRLGRPWDMAKGFDFSAPIGEIAPAAEIGHPESGAISLKLDGAPRQSANLSDLIWPVPDIIAALSAQVTLKAGDLIFTGTPAGVGPVRSGERLVGEIEGVGRVEARLI